MNLLAPEYQNKDSRRTLSQLFTSDIKQVNLYEAKKGCVLGDHFHKETIEFFHVVRGILTYNDSQVMTRGATFVVYPEEVHKLKCESDVTLMSFLSKPYDSKEPDIWKKS